jgi:hypothetical protein
LTEILTVVLNGLAPNAKRQSSDLRTGDHTTRQSMSDLKMKLNRMQDCVAIYDATLAGEAVGEVSEPLGKYIRELEIKLQDVEKAHESEEPLTYKGVPIKWDNDDDEKHYIIPMGFFSQARELPRPSLRVTQETFDYVVEKGWPNEHLIIDDINPQVGIFKMKEKAPEGA